MYDLSVFDDFNLDSLVPINSLKCKCLSQLASMMRQSESEQETRKSTSAVTAKSSNPRKRRKISASSSESQNTLKLSVDCVQLLIDYLIRERIKIRKEVFFALLSNGCYSLDFTVLYRSIEGPEPNKIMQILAKNCDHLRSLDLSDYDVSFENMGPIKLEQLTCSIWSLEQLFPIFSTFPNVTSLKVRASWEYPLIPPEITPFFAELNKPQYKQLRNSLKELSFIPYIDRWDGNDNSSSSFNIRLIASFPNLNKLDCSLSDEMFKMITKPQKTGCTDGNHVKVSATDLKKAAKVLEKLQGLRNDTEIKEDISVLTPNLVDLRLTSGNYPKNNIGNLKSLKRLSISFRFQKMEHELKKIGKNLEYLLLDLTHAVDVSTVARYCYNLKHFELKTDEISFSSKSNSKLSKQEKENLNKPFLHLKTFVLYRFDEKAFHYILEHAVNIEQIKLSGTRDSENLKIEKELTKLMEINPLKNLRVLDIKGFKSTATSNDQFNKLLPSFDKLSYARFSSSLY